MGLSIFSGRCVPADKEYFAYHVEGVDYCAYARVGRIDPSDGYLADGEVERACDADDLAVHPESVHALPGKDGSGAVLGEGFESTLSIGEGGETQNAQKKVVDAAHAAAVPGLRDFDDGAGQGSRADDHLGAVVEFGPELVDFVDRCGAVCVVEEAVGASRGDHALLNGIAFSVVGLVSDDADVGKTGTYDIAGVVGATVVHDDDFACVFLAGEVVLHEFESACDTGFFVEGRDYDGKMRVGIIGHI